MVFFLFVSFLGAGWRGARGDWEMFTFSVHGNGLFQSVTSSM
jgi:hypothetical protein